MILTPAAIASSFSVVLSGWAVGRASDMSRSSTRGYKQSSLTPPGWVFGVVWTFLYALIGIAIARADNKEMRMNLFVNLFINLGWTSVFRASPTVALAVVAWLLFDIVGIFLADTSNRFRLFLLPYIAWLTLATYLNAYIVFAADELTEDVA